MNIKVMRDHIVHYSWLDCFKNCFPFKSPCSLFLWGVHSLTSDRQLSILSSLSSVCRTGPPGTPERVWMKYSKHRHLVTERSITRTGARSKYWHSVRECFPALWGAGLMRHRPGAFMSLGMETIMACNGNFRSSGKVCKFWRVYQTKWPRIKIFFYWVVMDSLARIWAVNKSHPCVNSLKDLQL